MGADIDATAWPVPPIFGLLKEWGNVDWHEMYRTFNMGIGMIIIASADEAEKIKADLESRNEAVYEIGRVTEGSHEVVVRGGVFDE